MSIEIKLSTESEEKIAKMILNQVSNEIFKASQDNIIEFEAIDTGFMLRSGTLWQSGKLKNTISYQAPYSSVIEFGSAPHFPPIEPIQRWVERKLGNTTNSRQIAFAIAKRISLEGTKPRPFIRNAIIKIKNKYTR